MTHNFYKTCLISRYILLFVLISLPLASWADGVRREYRAVWLTTYLNLDWPSTPASSTQGAEAQKAELCEMLDSLSNIGINTVFVQARMRSTTSYRSAYELWDEAFTGTPGKSPLYDPLGFAVQECHKRGMECHAWVVVFPICKVPTAKRLGKKALPKQHAKLCQRCGDSWFMDPGVPETADYLAKICREIVENYDVDGIHLDYIRYPEREYRFNDNATYRKYGAKKPKPAWRRENVTRCVQAIHNAVKSVRPWVKLTCAPIGKHDDLARQSSYGWNARSAVFQDAQKWLKDGLMDALFPMMYFDGKHFYPFAIDWQDNNYGRPVVPGLGIYFLNDKLRGWPLEVIRRQMNVARDLGMGGQAFFRAKFLLDNEKGLYTWLKQSFYVEPALPPAMIWADSIAPETPNPSVELKDYTLHFKWSPISDATPVFYNLYRLDAATSSPRLLFSKLKSTQCVYTPPLPGLLYAEYAITAVDAYGNESPLNYISVLSPPSENSVSAEDRIKKVKEMFAGEK